MKNLVPILLAVAGVFVFLGGGGDLSLPTPDQAERPSREVSTPGLESALSKWEGPEQDRLVWAGMLEAIARYIQADGETSSPMVKAMFDVASVRDAALTGPIDGVSGGSVIAAALGPPLTALGVSDQPLDSNRRQAVVDVFLDAAYVLRGSNE